MGVKEHRSASPFPLSRSRQHQRDIIGLFLVADPVIHGGGDNLADLRKGQMTVIAH
jgi:hypothetical protein